MSRSFCVLLSCEVGTGLAIYGFICTQDKYEEKRPDGRTVKRSATIKLLKPTINMLTNQLVNQESQPAK